jgi:hypothetical protein
MRQQENQFILHDLEIDHRQHSGIHSDSLQMNAKKDSTVGEKVNTETYVNADDNRA